MCFGLSCSNVLWLILMLALSFLNNLNAFWRPLEDGDRHLDDLWLYKWGFCMVAVWKYHHNYRIQELSLWFLWVVCMPWTWLFCNVLSQSWCLFLMHVSKISNWFVDLLAWFASTFLLLFSQCFWEQALMHSLILYHVF